MFNDVIFSPLYAGYLSYILDKGVQKDLKGIYNIGCSNPISKLDFGLYLNDIFGLNSSYIIPISIDEKKSMASRPKQMQLAVEKVERAIEIKMPTVENQIILMYKDFEENQPERLRGLEK